MTITHFPHPCLERPPCDVQPSRIIEKIKLHLLTHLPEDIRRHGPALGGSTEAHESFNGVFRYSSIALNHQAASRDIAIDLGEQEALKHRLLGGYWPVDPNDPESSDWVQAGPQVRDILRRHPFLQKHVGWNSLESLLPGECNVLHNIIIDRHF